MEAGCLGGEFLSGFVIHTQFAAEARLLLCNLGGCVRLKLSITERRGDFTMQAIRVTQILDSETLYLPQLRPLMGQRVEIIVLSTDPVDLESVERDPPSESLVGSVLRYDDPQEPAALADEWEASR